jgi:hypothetical protein
VVDFYQNRYRDHAADGDLDVIIYNIVALTIPRQRTFKFLGSVQNLRQSTWNREIVYADRSSEDEQLIIRPLLRKAKAYEHGGRLKFKIHM